PQQGQHQGPPTPGRYSGQHPGAQYPSAPGAHQPGGNPGKPPMDPLQRQRILLRAAMVLVVSALLIFGASSFVLSPMPYFLGLFLFALVGLGLNVWAIVRTASARGPWIFYVAASLSILYSLMTVIGGIGLAVMPGMQEYRECRTAALTGTDMYTCDQMLQNSMDSFAGTGSTAGASSR
ncbi:MAG: 4-hydroxyphenylpyruvate dioxygenase, partial [Rothia sp.]|uniref:4-hydroxyphenylpyruvate dioxygenase n=1 Tax=Rothia sp. (in: high G+C Gram-positive bacteria) TaxID=1885016 RepID=UPI001CB6776F